MAKATEGLTYTDSDFAKNWKGMEASGIKVRGAYHFGHANDNAKAQVEHFLATVGTLKAGDFLVLDIEAADSQSPTQVASFSAEFVHLLRNKTHGKPVFVYTGAWFWDPQAGGSSSCQNFPLWVSGYSSSPPMPKGWSKWTFWQYSDKASVPGISGGCDYSRFYGTSAELHALVGLAPAAPTPKPAPPGPKPTPKPSHTGARCVSAVL